MQHLKHHYGKKGNLNWFNHHTCRPFREDPNAIFEVTELSGGYYLTVSHRLGAGTLSSAPGRSGESSVRSRAIWEVGGGGGGGGEKEAAGIGMQEAGQTAANSRLRCFHAKDLHGLCDDGAGVGLAVDAHDEGLVQQDVGVF